MFFITCTTKEGINTYQIVKAAFWLMYLVMCFGPFLGPNLPKYCHFSQNRRLRFFILCIMIEDINAYQMTKTASELIHFRPLSFRQSYGPKRGLWRHRDQKHDGPSYTIRLYLEDLVALMSSLTEVRLGVGVCIGDVTQSQHLNENP